MPTFFGRKYMRGAPDRTERILGVCILVLVVAVVAVFLLTGGLFKGFVDAHPALVRARSLFSISEKPLFVAAPENLPKPSPPRPAKARKLTPTTVTAAPTVPGVIGTTAAPQPKPTAGVARFADVPGTKLLAPTNVQRFAENMYEKIDGKESAYRAFFVIDLKFGQYADTEHQQTYDVYVYDMAAPQNALGIYMSERAESAAALPIGREGYASGGSIFFWKGRYYVNVLGPPEAGDTALPNSKAIAGVIAETIADAAEPFWADKLLPADNRVPNSFSYQATSALGYEFLQRVWSARYDMGGKRMQIFLTRTTDADAAKALFARFAESTGRYDKILSRDAMSGGELLVSETPMPNRPSKFGAAFNKGSYFGGVTACDDKDLAARSARALFEQLSANDPGDPEAVYREPDQPAEHDGSSESGTEGSEGQ